MTKQVSQEHRFNDIYFAMIQALEREIAGQSLSFAHSLKPSITVPQMVFASMSWGKADSAIPYSHLSVREVYHGSSLIRLAREACLGQQHLLHSLQHTLTCNCHTLDAQTARES